MGSHSLLQGIFPTQGSNLGLPHYRWILYYLSHHGGQCLRGEESACNAGDTRDAGLIPGSGRSPGDGNGNCLQEIPWTEEEAVGGAVDYRVRLL